MLRLYSDITIGAFRFPFITEVSTDENRDNLTATAEITIPDRFNRRNEFITDDISIGSEVVIRCGYYPTLTEIFRGYVSKLSPGLPARFYCEDAMFLQKQKTVGATELTDTTFEKLIDAVYSGEYAVLDANIGDWRISEYATPVDVFDELRSKFGALIYFKDDLLHVNAETLNNETVAKLDFQLNVLPDHDLTFQRDTDLNVISYGKSKQRDGTLIELYAFYTDQTARDNITVTEIKPPGTLNKTEVTNVTKETLTDLIKQRLPKLYYTGISGTLTTFGEPYIRHGDNVELFDREYPERNGIYRVNSVKRSFGAGGFWQTIEIGLKIG